MLRRLAVLASRPGEGLAMMGFRAKVRYEEFVADLLEEVLRYGQIVSRSNP